MSYKFNVGTEVHYKNQLMIIKEQVERHPRALPETPQLYVLQFPDRDSTRLAWEDEIKIQEGARDYPTAERS